MKRNVFRDVIYAIFVVAMLMLVFNFLRSGSEGPTYAYSDIRHLLETEQVETVKVTERAVRFTLRTEVNGSKAFTYPIRFDVFYSDFNELVVDQWEAGIIVSYDYPGERSGTSWMNGMMLVLSVIVVVVVFWYFITLRQMRNGGGGVGGGGNRAPQFGRARTKIMSDEDKLVTFADVAGADEEKEELREIVEFLRAPNHFLELGARIPKGVLLVGPPGTGKTLLARAVAGEAGVSFLSISGSDFVELYVGVGASRVRDLFEQAKKVSPSIVFIDEIDAVGRQRGTGLGGGHDEREQTLNQLLVEMDGFAANEGVIVMAATNRADVLDPALLRPGRFDRQVYVGRPDIRGREDILKIYVKNKPLSEDVNLRDIARATSGFTGADLENLMNEAALLAARQEKRVISMADVEEAMLKVIAGPEKRSRVVPDHAKRLTAYHEAGHAVVMRALPTQDSVHHITIIPRGAAGGMTVSLPREDRPYQAKGELMESICALLGGRVAEELVLGDSSTGASNDLKRATAIARAMVTKYGMSARLGTISFDDDHEVFIGRSMAQSRSYSEEVAGIIDEEIKRIVDEQYKACAAILQSQREKLELVASYLLEHETMSGEEFDLAFTNPEALA
ncbi:MAG: Cell division protein FtsH [Firmicutes bacterium]|nr:Cell division protein FtsH [Bacillota bacterium]